MPPLLTIQKVAYVAPRLIAAQARPGPHCVMASAVGQMVLEEFDIVATPFSVEVAVFNAEWVEWVKEQCPGGGEEQLRRGAYILTNTPNWQGGEVRSRSPTHKPWNGHLVLEAEGQLIDLNVGAFARPEHRIFVPPALVTPLRANRTVVGGWVHNGASTHVTYEPMRSPVQDDYLTSRDWVERDRYLDLVWEITTRVRSLRVEARS